MGTTTERERPPVEQRVCRAIRLLARGSPEAEVARAVRVMPQTLARWQQSTDFQVLLACLKENGRLRDALAELDTLTPDAINALRRALANENDRVAVQAARDILDRAGVSRRTGAHAQPDDQATEQVIRLEYVNPAGQPYAAAPWADRHPRTSGEVQGGELRSPVREDRDGQDHAC
jgi:hypothetical protein